MSTLDSLTGCTGSCWWRATQCQMAGEGGISASQPMDSWLHLWEVRCSALAAPQCCVQLPVSTLSVVLSASHIQQTFCNTKISWLGCVGVDHSLQCCQRSVRVSRYLQDQSHLNTAMYIMLQQPTHPTSRVQHTSCDTICPRVLPYR